MANFGDFKTTNTFGNLWEQEPVPQDPLYCYGVLQADATFSYIRIGWSNRIEVSDLTIWKTCRCYPPMMNWCSEHEPTWTNPREGQFHAEMCVLEHKCLDDVNERYKTCNHAYLEKCKTANSGVGLGLHYGSVEEAKTFVKGQMLTCYHDEIGPCKTAH